ncbi:CDP-alcohol phosphatidyltransferase family protein [Stakelama tenebrarum]|uniref:CDP-alcohol phosphatidyltransferase family protein n=1 Tax=Stakelama tenebrarum TaxID=2711215 RepID=A0A6G6Y5F9_9SPHN|nr:CDP-alcohol phosphatidyltransferase family protein [Sphingosinithalassobacter tenebrarum]QIG80037.1 CDP-alcohol phosphatidyltransferase family protein [Sphingosinithalassobacter tenebrarum]
MTVSDGRKPKPITRIQQNLLAKGERRLLNWLCSRLPGWVTPDILTSLGLVGAAAIFVGYAASGLGQAWLWLAIGGYVIQWFGDSLDGSLARYRKIERPAFGYFIDHSCDGITTLLILAGIGLSPYVRLDVALVALAGYFLLSIHAYLSAHVIGEFKLSYLSAGPTELRFVLIGMTLAMMIVGPNSGTLFPMSVFDVIVGSIGSLLIFLFVIQTYVTMRRILARGEA